MATRHAAVARDPSDLSAALALADGAEYLLENTGPRAVVLAEAEAAPVDRIGHVLPAPDARNPAAVSLRTVTAPAAPARLWAWSDGATVVATES